MALLIENQKAHIEQSGKRTFIHGVFLVGDVVNKNKRLYPTAMLEQVVERARSDIRSGTASSLGMLGHPAGQTTDPMRISHVVKSLERSGNSWVGKAELVNEGAGNVAKAIIQAGGKLGISSRGLGELRKAGTHSIVEGYNLLAFDLVADPSTPGSFVNAVLEAKLPLRESNLALDILRSMGYPELADLQARNGTDWDKGPGNFIPGHAGFPSAQDDRTHPERVYADSAEMIRKLAGIVQQFTKDGLSPNQIKQLVDALSPKQSAQESYNAAARSVAKDIIAGNNLKRSQLLAERKQAAEMDYVKRTLKGMSRSKFHSPNTIDFDGMIEGFKNKNRFR